MSFCRNCNLELNEEYSFCPECGSKISKSNAFCTCCGNKYEQENKFCPYCGAKNGQSEEAPCTEPVKREEKKVSLKNAIISLVMSAGIMPIFVIYSFFPIFCFFFFPGVILFYCLSIRFANLYEKEANRTIGFTTASRIVALVSLIVGIVLFVIGFSLTIAFFNY